ncbi:MAG: Stf0 family sulfotransferase [Pseudomonadota bacterium]
MDNLVHKAIRKTHEHAQELRHSLAAAGALPSTNDFRRLVLLSTIRTGSTMLGFRLAAHPAVSMFQEVFHVHRNSVSFQKVGFQRKSTTPKILRLRENEPSRFLEEIIFARKPRGIKWVGFRLMYNQARVDNPFWTGPEFDHWYANGKRPPQYGNKHDNVRNWLEKNAEKIDVIHLIRENLFDQYLSGEVAKKTGAWGEGATGGWRGDDGVSIELNPDHTVQHIQTTQKMIDEGRDWCRQFRTLEITYDELVKNDGMKRVFEFLGLDVLDAGETRSRKQGKTDWTEKVSNSDEIREALSRSGYGHFVG